MKTLGQVLKKNAGTLSKKNETKIYAKYADDQAHTTLMHKFGNKFLVTQSTDVTLPIAVEVSVPTLPGRAGVSS